MGQQTGFPNIRAGIQLPTPRLEPQANGILDGTIVLSKNDNSWIYAIARSTFTLGGAPFFEIIQYIAQNNGKVTDLLSKAGAVVQHLTLSPPAGLDTTDLTKTVENIWEKTQEMGGSSTGSAFIWSIISNVVEVYIEDIEVAKRKIQAILEDNDQELFSEAPILFEVGEASLSLPMIKDLFEQIDPNSKPDLIEHESSISQNLEVLKQVLDDLDIKLPVDAEPEEVISTLRSICAMGSDYGGSMRDPAAAQGVVGIKTNITRSTIEGREDPSDIESFSAYGALLNIAKILKTLNPVHDYLKYFQEGPKNPISIPSKKIAILKGNLSTDKPGETAEASVANEIALEHFCGRLEALGHNVVAIDAPLNYKIRERRYLKQRQRLGLSDNPLEPMLTKRQVKKLRRAYMELTTIHGEQIAKDCEDIAKDYLKRDLTNQERSYLKDFLRGGAKKEHLTDRVWIAAKLGQAFTKNGLFKRSKVKRIEHIRKVFAECQEAAKTWYEQYDFVVMQGQVDPFSEPKSVLSDAETKHLSAAIESSLFERFGSSATPLIVQYLASSSFPNKSYENALNLFAVHIPETIQKNRNGNWVPVGVSLSTLNQNASEVFGLLAQLEQGELPTNGKAFSSRVANTVGWNTPINRSVNRPIDPETNLPLTRAAVVRKQILAS